MSNTNTNLPTQTSSVLQNDTVSSCSISKVQEKTQLSRIKCMNSLRATQTTFENAFNSEFKARMQIYTRFDAQSFYDAMIFNMDSSGKYMHEITLHQQRTPQVLKQKKLMQTQEDHSNPIPALNVDSLKVDLVVIQNTCSEKEDSNSKTASSKSLKESSMNSETKDVHAIKYNMSKAKEICMAYFRSLHSHLQVYFKEDLKGTRIEHGFKQAFMSLFGQDNETFSTFWVVNNQFQKFIDSQFTLDYDSQMTDKYFVEYTRIKVKHFRDTLLQHMGNVKKFVAERTRHQRQYDRRVNKRQMQTQESKIDTGKAVDDDLVVTKSSGTKSKVQDESSRSGNDTDTDDAHIRPIYDEEPMAEVQLTAECNIFAIGQQHTKQPEIINEGRVDQYTEQCQVKSLMLDSSPDNQTTDTQNNLLEYIFQSEKERIRVRSSLEPQCQMTFDHNRSSLEPQCQQKFIKQLRLVTTSNEAGFTIRFLFDEYFQWRSYALSWKPCQGDSLNLPDHRYSIYTIKRETGGLDGSVLQLIPAEVGFINPHAILTVFTVNHSTAQVDQESQIKMIQVKEMMQDNDLKNSKSNDKGSRSRSQSMNDQSHYKQDKTKTRQSINVKSHILNVIGGTEECEERDLNIGGDC
ncbi:hypothetical protein Tco_1458023 [Tanacetum coccineum]